MSAPDPLTRREYVPVLTEITTAVFACSDCGAVVWYSLRDAHDGWHKQADDRREQIEALIATTWRHTELLDTDEQRLDDHAGQIASLQNQAGDLESQAHRLDDAVRDVGYRVDEAVRASERAADAAARGW